MSLDLGGWALMCIKSTASATCQLPEIRNCNEIKWKTVLNQCSNRCNESPRVSVLRGVWFDARRAPLCIDHITNGNYSKLMQLSPAQYNVIEWIVRNSGSLIIIHSGFADFLSHFRCWRTYDCPGQSRWFTACQSASNTTDP